MEEQEFLIQLGAKIKAIRMSKNIKQREITEATGLKRARFGGIEKGRVNTHILTLKKMADAMGVDLKDFI